MVSARSPIHSWHLPRSSGCATGTHFLENGTPVCARHSGTRLARRASMARRQHHGLAALPSLLARKTLRLRRALACRFAAHLGCRRLRAPRFSILACASLTASHSRRIVGRPRLMDTGLVISLACPLRYFIARHCALRGWRAFTGTNNAPARRGCALNVR